MNKRIYNLRNVLGYRMLNWKCIYLINQDTACGHVYRLVTCKPRPRGRYPSRHRGCVTPKIMIMAYLHNGIQVLSIYVPPAAAAAAGRAPAQGTAGAVEGEAWDDVEIDRVLVGPIGPGSRSYVEQVMLGRWGGEFESRIPVWRPKHGSMSPL